MAKILIVDDSIVMRNNLEYMLTKEGHKVVGKATNGKEAVTLYKELKPDLVTMDISMPILNGVDAVSQIISHDSEAKIIMISALNQKQILFDAIKRGARHYIIKPLETQDVVNIVNKVLAQPKTLIKEDRNKKQEEINTKIENFQIKNINGAFVISIGGQMDNEALNALDLTVQGLILVKPLKIVMDFGDMQDIQDEVLVFVQTLSQKMSQIDGDLSYNIKSSIIKGKLNQKI